jgi:putative ABC transport system substrate-binding protein
MKRREFIALLGGAAAWPLAAPAQQSNIPVVGFVRSTSRADSIHLANAFSQGLREAGFSDGRNARIEFRYADDKASRLLALLSDVIEKRAAVIMVNPPAAHVALKAKMDVPLIFAMGGDPVANGLVASLNHPGGTVTGIVFFSSALGPKRLELLRQLVPKAKAIGVLVNERNRETASEAKDIEAAARALGQRLVTVVVNTPEEIPAGFESLTRSGAEAVIVGSGPLFNSKRAEIVALSARYALPASYSLREYALAGGLMSYGASITDAYRQAGGYAARILRGEKPADLPVIQATKLELVINLKAAKSLGLQVPPTLLARADEVIE